jgi:hypothetical protein
MLITCDPIYALAPVTRTVDPGGNVYWFLVMLILNCPLTARMCRKEIDVAAERRKTGGNV